MKKCLLLVFCLYLLIRIGFSQNLLSNGDFELGYWGNCPCPTGFTCFNDAGRVVDGVDPLFFVGAQGCLAFPFPSTNYTNPLDAHSGTGYVYFYAGGDYLLSDNVFFSGPTQVDICVWYAGPQGQGASGQNTPKAHFSIAIDGIQVSPDVLVPVGTVWTQYCFTYNITTGNHNFAILSGDPGNYSMWFDDFSVSCPSPIVSLGNDTILCQGDTLSLNVSSPGATYIWQDNSTNPLYYITHQGTYSVLVTNTCGFATDTIHLDYINIPTVELGNDTTLCPGETLILNANSQSANYLWQDNSTDSAYIISQQGTYWVEVMNYCDIVSDTIHVNYYPVSSSIADAGDDTKINAGGSVQLNGTGGINYFWYPSAGLSCTNCPDPIASPLSTTNYILVVSDSSGCYNSDTVSVFVNELECGDVFVPNAFSPNGDGTNDLLFVRGNCIEKFHFEIFDRWGERVFQSKALSNGWNGMYHGVQCNLGVFVWHLTATLKDGSTLSKKGNIILIR